jgi:hypothetical protein
MPFFCTAKHSSRGRCYDFKNIFVKIGEKSGHFDSNYCYPRTKLNHNIGFQEKHQFMCICIRRKMAIITEKSDQKIDPRLWNLQGVIRIQRRIVFLRQFFCKI